MSDKVKVSPDAVAAVSMAVNTVVQVVMRRSLFPANLADLYSPSCSVLTVNPVSDALLHTSGYNDVIRSCGIKKQSVEGTSSASIAI